MQNTCPYQIVNPVGTNGGPKFPLTSGYGPRTAPLPGASTFHKGIDIGAPEGTPVLAAKDGILSSIVYNDPGAGNWIKLRHDDGTYTVYMHLLDVENMFPQQKLYAGEQIGTVGSTGRSTGPHLHFEIRDSQWNAIDPTECYANALTSYEDPYQRAVKDEMKEIWGNTEPHNTLPNNIDPATVIEPMTADEQDRLLRKQRLKQLAWGVCGMALVGTLWLLLKDDDNKKGQPYRPRYTG